MGIGQEDGLVSDQPLVRHNITSYQLGPRNRFTDLDKP